MENPIQSCDECRNHQRKATGHLITSSARYRRDGGIVRLICFVVLGSPGSRADYFRTCNGLNLRTTLSRAELPSANNPLVYPGAQGE
jgi:hypothetical protein